MTSVRIRIIPILKKGLELLVVDLMIILIWMIFVNLTMIRRF